jgi:hypothetical protein
MDEREGWEVVAVTRRANKKRSGGERDDRDGV